MPLKLLSPGGGSVLLQANTTSLDYTLTVPAETANLITTATTSGINASAMSVGTVPRARMPAGTVLQTQYVASGTRTTVNSTSFTEPSSGYRVTLTPISTSSLIIIKYYVPCNPGANYQSNTLFSFRSFRIIGGSTTYSLTSTGDSNGIRNAFAGMSVRPPGYDLNDTIPVYWQAVDLPNTTSACTYGFEFKREGGGTGTMYFGYSSGNNSDWGWDSDIVIVAQEIAQ